MAKYGEKKLTNHSPLFYFVTYTKRVMCANFVANCVVVLLMMGDCLHNAHNYKGLGIEA